MSFKLADLISMIDSAVNEAAKAERQRPGQEIAHIRMHRRNVPAAEAAVQDEGGPSAPEIQENVDTAEDNGNIDRDGAQMEMEHINESTADATTAWEFDARELTKAVIYSEILAAPKAYRSLKHVVR